MSAHQSTPTASIAVGQYCELLGTVLKLRENARHLLAGNTAAGYRLSKGMGGGGLRELACLTVENAAQTCSKSRHSQRALSSSVWQD